MQSDQYQYTVSKSKEGQVEVKVTVTSELVKSTEEEVFEDLKDTVKIKGFRPGKAPKADVKAKLGIKLLDETLTKLFPKIAVEIVEAENFSPITQVNYNFEGFADDGDFKFSFDFTNYPEIKLGNLQKIKIKKEEPEVEQKEIDEVINRIFKDELGENAPEEIDDEKVKSLKLENISTVSDLRSQIEGRIKTIKDNDLRRDYHNKILEEAINISDIPIPPALLDQQAESLLDDHLNQIKQIGVEVDDFLQAQGITREELEKQKKEEAKNKISAEFILNEIAKENSIIPTEEDIQAEIDAIKDPEIRDNYESVQGRRHILSLIVQQRGMQKLVDIVEKNN